MRQARCHGFRKSIRRPYPKIPVQRFILDAVLLVAIAFPALAQIQGSAHDFSQEGWSGGELCAVCHAPHGGNGTNQTAPMWNHELSSASYTPYRSSTLTQSMEQPGSASVSRLCLSCHDGTIALDSFGGRQGGTYIPNSLSLGTDLSDDHPISVRAIRPVNSEGAGSENSVKLYDGRVECPSCHDVHNNNVSDDKLLRVARTKSKLCLQCHDM